MHVLVTDDSYYSTLGIVRSLGAKGIRVSVLADTPGRLGSLSRYSSARYAVPSPREETFVPALIQVLRREKFDLLMPVGYEMVAAVARHKEELAPLVKLEVSDYEKILSAADKRYANALAESLGVPAPKSICPKSIDEATELSAGLQYPVVIKGQGEAVKVPVQYAKTRDEFLKLFRTLWDREPLARSHPPLVQEYIPGFGCGFFAFYQHGVCKRVFMHRRVRETPPSGGISCCAASYYDAKLKEYGMRLLNHLEWHGVAMVEFRYDLRDCDYKLVEINPKFWGSLNLALAAGVDFPYFLCQAAQGQTLEYSEEYNRSLRFHWPLLELQHLLLRPASIGEMLVDFLNPRVKSNFSWHDLQPNFMEPFVRLYARTCRQAARKHPRYTEQPALQKVESRRQ